MEKHIIKTRKLTFNNLAKKPQCLHTTYNFGFVTISSEPVSSN